MYMHINMYMYSNIKNFSIKTVGIICMRDYKEQSGEYISIGGFLPYKIVNGRIKNIYW
jgi:hypothetical protein